MGGRSKKYLYIIRARKKSYEKKKIRKPRSPKIYSCTALKNHAKKMLTKKFLCSSKIPHPSLADKF